MKIARADLIAVDEERKHEQAVASWREAEAAFQIAQKELNARDGRRSGTRVRAESARVRHKRLVDERAAFLREQSGDPTTGAHVYATKPRAEQS